MNRQSLPFIPVGLALLNSAKARVLTLLFLLLLAAQLHGDVGGDNPPGVAGAFNGSIQTGRGYDPYTGNATTSCTDIIVTSVGKYPLALVRTANSRGVGRANTFGLAGHWNHNYNWIVEDSGSSTNSGFAPSSYTVDFPDGRVATFKDVNDSWDIKWRVVSATGAALGIRERFQPMDQNKIANLFLPDGGKVEFKGTLKNFQKSGTTYWYYSYVAQAIYDPYGLKTTLDHDNNDGSLLAVTEPAGRSLQFSYTTVSSTKVIQKVTEVINGANKRVVQYNYGTISPGGQGYAALTSVGYYGASPTWTASYTYCAPNIAPASGVPLLKTCDEPIYSGPMHKLAYIYRTTNNADGTSPVYGQIQSENYYNGTVGAAVSTLAITGTNTRSETRGDGKTRTFTYGTGGNSGFLTSWTDFMNNSASQGYDTYKYLNSVTDRNNHTTNYTCDAITGNVTQVQFPAITAPSPAPRGTLNYTYTNNYYLHFADDEAGNRTTYNRDSNNRVYEIRYPDGGYEAFSYDSAHKYQLQTHTMTTAGVESWTYDAYHRKDTYRNPDNVTGNPTARYGYDDYDRVQDVTGPIGTGLGDGNATTTYAYNLRDQVLTTTLPFDPFANRRCTITDVYNLDGSLQSRSDQLGHTTSYTYDDYRRVRSVKTPRDQANNIYYTTSLYYDANGLGDDYRYTDSNVTWVFLPSGKKTNTHYDDNRRKDYVISGYGSADAAKTSYVYDPVGNLKKVTAPEGQPGGLFPNTSTQTDYDEQNRPWQVTDALNQHTTITYDALGRRKTLTRPNNQTITNDSFDQMNRVTQQTATDVGTTKYTYYGSGLLHTMQDPRQVISNGEQYEYIYDAMGRKQWVTYPHDANGVQKVEYFSYDTSDNANGPRLGTGTLYQYLNRNGKIQSFGYDNLNRMVSFSWDDNITPDTLFWYDGASRLKDVNTDNYNITVHREYFDDNLLKSETENTTPLGGTSKTVTYDYDGDGNRGTFTYPNNSYSFTYAYTGRNQLKNIYNGGSSLATYGYNLNGDMASRLLLANGGLGSSYTYDALDRVTNVTHPLHRDYTRSFDYDYDSVGNRKWSKYEDGYGDVFAYDKNDQVTATLFEVEHPNTTSVGPQTIFYDGAGNRTFFQPYDTLWAYAANQLNQYTTRTPSFNPLRPTPTPRPRPSPTPRPTPPGQQAAVYDYAGNMTTGFDGSNYTYDAQNRLLSAAIGSVSMTFKYDGLNRQISRTVNGVTTFGVWDGWQLIEEYRSGNNVQARYLYGPNGLVKNLTSGNYYFQDGSGSTSHLTDDLGQVIESYLYDVHGTPMFYDQTGNPLSASAYGVRHLFTGQQWYQEIGLYDLRNRFYSPDIGRFLQADPTGFNGDANNLYRYCGNNPVTSSDPLGLDYWTSYATKGFTVPWLGYGGFVVASFVVTAPDLPGGVATYPWGGSFVTQPLNMETPHAITSPAQDLVIRDALATTINPLANPYQIAQNALRGGGFDPINPFTGDITNNQGDWIGWEDPYTGNVYNSQWKWAGWDKNYGQTFSVADTPSVAPVVVSAPSLSKNEQAKLRGLERLAKIYNPYSGYLPTTNTMNWAGGLAGPNVISTWDTDSTNSPTLSNFGNITIGMGMPIMEPGIGPGSCFVAGTPVLMANGSEKPIESVQIGEAVLAWNEETNKVFPSKVVNALHHEEKMQTLFDIELEDGRTFTVNNDHPMYVLEDGDFTFTDELAARFAKGKPITFQDSRNQPVKVASLRMRKEKCKMYNLHVEGQGKNGHTYYANGILVHNSGSGYKFK